MLVQMFMLRQYVKLERNPFTTIEILPSDMGGDYDALETLMASRPDILNHNIETVRRLTPSSCACDLRQNIRVFTSFKRITTGYPN